MKALRHRAVLAFLIFNLLVGVLFVGGALLVSFIRSFGTTPAQLGLILGAGWGASVLGALCDGPLSDSIGPRRTVLCSAALVAAGLLSMGAQAAILPASMALLSSGFLRQLSSPLGRKVQSFKPRKMNA